MSEAVASNATSILIVDDMPENLEVLDGLLRSAGYRVKVATNGRTALRLAAEPEPPSLILLDVMMPVMDGYTVLDRLLGDEEARRVAAELLGALPGTPGASKPAEDLSALVTQVVRRVGKAHARRRLGESAFVELVPQPELFDV